MDIVELGLATAISWFLLTYLKGLYEPNILILAGKVFVVAPNAEHTLPSMRRRKGFFPISSTCAMDKVVLFIIQWMLIPLASTIPWYWYFVRLQA